MKMRLGADVAPARAAEENKDGYRGGDGWQIRNPAVAAIGVLPMMPKMSRMDGTKITSRLTRKMRQNAMPKWTTQRNGLSGKRIWSKALRICKEKHRDGELYWWSGSNKCFHAIKLLQVKTEWTVANTNSSSSRTTFCKIPAGEVSGLLGINLQDVQDTNYNSESNIKQDAVLLIEGDVFQLSPPFQFKVNTWTHCNVSSVSRLNSSLLSVYTAPYH